MFGCAKDETPQIYDNANLVKKTFFAYTEEQTKTSLDADLEVLWTSGDQISVFDGTNNTAFTTQGDKVTSAEFEGYTAPTESATYYALYPYSADATFADGVITTELPLVQKAVLNGFDEEVAMMVAKTTDDKLSFKNVNALLKITVPENSNFRAIGFTTSNSRLTGKFDIAFDESGNVAVTPDAEQDQVAHRDVYLSNGNTALAPGSYYLVVMPGSYQNLFLSVETTDGKLYVKYQKKFDGKEGRFEIMSNEVRDLGTIPADFAGSKAFNLTNLPEGPVSMDESYVLGYEIGENYTGKNVTASGVNNNIITATNVDVENNNVIVTFGKNPGTASMYVKYDAITYPVTFDVRPWLRNSPSNWQSNNEVTTYSYDESAGCAKVTSTTTSIQWKNESVLLSRKHAPYVCVHMSDLGEVPATGQTAATMKLDFANFKFNSEKGWGGAADDGDDKWKHQYKLSDDSVIYVYNLNENTLKNNDTGEKMVVPEDFEAKGKITCKVDKTAGLDFYGLSTHESLTQLEEFIESKGFTYTKVK